MPKFNFNNKSKKFQNYGVNEWTNSDMWFQWLTSLMLVLFCYISELES